MPSDEDLETYRIVFELFDRDRSGFIDSHDLAAISVKLGKDPSEVFALIGNFDLNQDGKVSFGEFVQSLWHLQKVEDANEHLMVSQSMQMRYPGDMSYSMGGSQQMVNLETSVQEGEHPTSTLPATELNS